MKIFCLILFVFLLVMGFGELMNDTSSGRGWFFILASVVAFLVVFGSRLNIYLGSGVSDWGDSDGGDGGDGGGGD